MRPAAKMFAFFQAKNHDIQKTANKQSEDKDDELKKYHVSAERGQVPLNINLLPPPISYSCH